MTEEKNVQAHTPRLDHVLGALQTEVQFVCDIIDEHRATIRAQSAALAAREDEISQLLHRCNVLLKLGCRLADENGHHIIVQCAHTTGDIWTAWTDLQAAIATVERPL